MEFMKKVSLRASLPVIFLKEKRQFVAYTPALDLSTSGRSLKEAQKNFVEAAQIFLEECYKMGTLSKILTDLGWKKKKNAWTPPVVIARGSRELNIPIPVFVIKNNLRLLGVSVAQYLEIIRKEF